MIRRLCHVLSYPVVLALKPLKLYAYRTRFPILGRFILMLTTIVDFCLIWLNVQNETMQMHWQAYGGNFIFGRAVMIVQHARTDEEIRCPAFRSNNFMGVSIVSSDSSAFATNAGILNQCPATRQGTRRYLDDHVFTRAVLELNRDTIRERCTEILSDWYQDPRMADAFVLRSSVTRMVLNLLSDVTVPYDVAGSATRQYIRRFVELSLFSGYLPVLLDLLGTRKKIRQDAYFRLKDFGIDIMAVDVTLFAAMFSIGTLLIRCVEDTRRFGIDYAALSPEHRRRFIIEVVRLNPTVTTVHRLVEREESVVVCGRQLTLTPGDEVAYPFVCSNRDPVVFPNPDQIDLDRPEEAYERVLSWSKGPHACPAKELSLDVTQVMLDALADRYELAKLRIFNPAF